MKTGTPRRFVKIKLEKHKARKAGKAKARRLINAADDGPPIQVNVIPFWRRLFR